MDTRNIRINHIGINELSGLTNRLISTKHSKKRTIMTMMFTIEATKIKIAVFTFLFIETLLSISTVGTLFLLLSGTAAE